MSLLLCLDKMFRQGNENELSLLWHIQCNLIMDLKLKTYLAEAEVQLLGNDILLLCAAHAIFCCKVNRSLFGRCCI